MPKIKINEVNGKPACGGVTLTPGPHNKLRPGETADVEDLAPFQGLIDRGILVTVAGRPKKVTTDATHPHTSPDARQP